MRLLISSFDATIRVKRAFHPAPASRGFASHVFLVNMIFENSSPKGIFGPNMSDSPNWSLTANSRSLQAAALKSSKKKKKKENKQTKYEVSTYTLLNYANIVRH